MTKKKEKLPADVSQLAKSIVDRTTGMDVQQSNSHSKEKNPAAVALGRLGGLKGGKARAEKLSAKKRTEIARKAAQTRWEKH